MIRSMTGYGKAECELALKKITIEVKSLNSKQLDLNTRIPGVYREKEIEIRREISDKLIRGKVDFSLYSESLGVESNSVINSPMVKSYFSQLSELSNELGLPVSELTLQIIMQLPEVVKTSRDEPDENEWKINVNAIREALNALDNFRLQEGLSLYNDIINNLNTITTLLGQITPYELERTVKVKERIMEGLKELSSPEGVDHNRLEQEMIFYLEKLDINEEKVRLGNHCSYFIETLALDEPIGKKLGFIAQEIGREINTLGSKANHTEMQKLVIGMKDALEKIKEQLLNVL
ncbi:MAG: YicC family protein [Bacteroidia bacterium]|nr:YicC family protein [Bacteroidia bacterium]